MPAVNFRVARWSDDETSSGGTTDEKIIASQITGGARNENALTDAVFFARHPELHRTPIAVRQRQLAAEWLQIRDRLVRPALAAATGAAPTPAPPSGRGPLPAPSPTK